MNILHIYKDYFPFLVALKIMCACWPKRVWSAATT